MREVAGSKTSLANRILAALVLASLILALAVHDAHASGPRWVAGSSYFNPSTKGQPIIWNNGRIAYFTDLGNLSTQVNQAQADAMVATAAAVWSNVNTAAVSIQWGGSLAEDVSGSNVIAGASGLTLPADIQPSATSKPVAVVYDEDGSVINALYGPGASSAIVCQNNGVLVMVDNLAVTANIAHALVLVNGLCATSAAQIATLQYQLIRAFGRVIGLDWSQTNEEMFATHQPTADGLTGWPIMHPVELLCNSGSDVCMPSPTVLRTDDVAALNRLYPVTAANVAQFPGKTITASVTFSVQGTVQFARGQGMQGVNVILQPLVNGVPDIRYTATAVSGVYFEGNAGNAVTGSVDASGNPLTRFGSDDPSLEGFFDLSGIPLPPGVTTSQYQLTFEPLNPSYIGSSSVGPYTTGQVTPSGTMPVIALGTLGAGSAATRTILIDDSADTVQSGADGTEGSPASAPVSGEWTARTTGYSHSGWFQWWAKGGREFTIEGQALDENGNNTENKTQIVIGAWNGIAAAGVLPVTGTPLPFNGSMTGLTTLPVLTIADSEVRIGISDFRGDGRPDYAYRGRILYADSVTPARIPVQGGPIVISGMGFRPSVIVTVNGVAAQIDSVTPNSIVAMAPPAGAVTGNVQVQIFDSQTLGIAAINEGVSYDAQSNDGLSILNAPLGPVAMGVPQPFTVRALNVGTQTPASGVTVTFTVTEGTAVLGCAQTSCSAVTAGDGTATLSVTPNSASLAQITAALTNGSNVLAEFTGTVAPSIAALTPNLYLAMGSTVDWQVEAFVLNPSGLPLAGQAITWKSTASGIIPSGAQTVSALTGLASNQLVAGPLNAGVTSSISACLAGTSACAPFTVTPVQPQTAVLAQWSGTPQYIPASQAFAPVILRVTDAFNHPLAGATVIFAEALDGWTEPCPTQGSCPPAPVLAQQTIVATSAVDGTVTLTPLSANGMAARLLVTAATGASTLNFELDGHP